MGIFTNTFDLIRHGGFMMVPLLASSLVALTIIFERFYLFSRVFHTPSDYLTQVTGLVASKKIPEAIAECAGKTFPVADVLKTGLENFEAPSNEVELSMKNCAESWVPLLEKRIDVIDTVITAAPLMGLLGTITGMMSSFQVLSEKGVNEPNAITGGVAESLIATATGLIIALVCLVAYNHLTSKIKYMIYEIEAAAGKVIELKMAADRKK